MKIRDCLLALCLALLLVGRTSATDVKKLPIDGEVFGGPWRIHESKGGGNVIGPAVTDRCFRYSNGRKIIRDPNDKLHVVYVDPYPSDPGDIPPSDGPYQSCTYATSTDGGLTWERRFLDADFFSRYPAIAIHGNTLHVVYTNWESRTSFSNIEYNRSMDLGETWLPEPINITPNEYLTGDCDFAGLDVDQDGNPHVSFIWPGNQAVYWTMSTDGGDTWTPADQVSYGQPNGTISFTNVYINVHTNQPHIIFTADGTPDFYGDKNYYHSFYVDGIWSYPTENVTGHPANDAHCWGCGTLVFDGDGEEYTAYLFVDDQDGGPPGGLYSGIGVYRRTDFSTNLEVDPLEVWSKLVVVADRGEAQFESDPWFPSAAINPGGNQGSASDDTIFCVFSTGEAGLENVGEIFIKYSTDKGETWQNDWPRNPLTTDGDVNFDNWPEVDWGHWTPGHLDVAWVAGAGSAYEVLYFDAYIPLVSHDAAVVGVELPRLIRRGDEVAISSTIGNKGLEDLLPVKVYCTICDTATFKSVVYRDSAETDIILVGEETRVSFPSSWRVDEESFYSGIYTVTCSVAYYAAIDSFPQNDVFSTEVWAFPGDEAHVFEIFDTLYSLGDAGWTVVDSLNQGWGWMLVIEDEEAGELSAGCGTALNGYVPQAMDELLISPPIDCSASFPPDTFLWLEFVETKRAGFYSANPMWLTTLVSTDGVEWDTIPYGAYYAPDDGTSDNFVNCDRSRRGCDITPLVPTGHREGVQVLFRFTMLGHGGDYDGWWFIDNFTLTSRDRTLAEIGDDHPSPSSHPTKYVLSQNYPNPFNPSTEISYDLPRGEDVRLTVYNVLGQRIRTLVDERQSAGRHLARWDGRDDSGNLAASGVYFYRLEAGEFAQTRRMLFLK